MTNLRFFAYVVIPYFHDSGLRQECILGFHILREFRFVSDGFSEVIVNPRYAALAICPCIHTLALREPLRSET